MMRSQTPREWRLVYGLVVLAAAVLMAYSVRDAFSPVLLFLLLLLLSSPYAGTRRHLLLVLGASLLLGIWLLETLGGLLAPFILAIGIAYILDPAVDRLEARRVPRLAGVAILALPVLGTLALVLFLGVPALIDQVEALVERLPEAGAQLSAWLERTRQRLALMNIPLVPAGRLAEQLSPDRIAAYIQERQDEILAHGWSAALGVGRGFGVALTILGYVVLTPVLVIYILRDFNTLTERAVALFPQDKRATWTAFLREYDALLARFLRGQVVAAAIVGVLTWIGLWIVGFPFAGLVGLVAGVFNLVPYLGLIVSVIPVIIIALVTGSFLESILRAGIVFAIVQLIDSTITGPRIVGESVGLHPVWVMLALALGSFFFGFVGLLLAMPIAVLVKLLLRDWLARYHASRVFRGGAITDETA